MHQAGPLPLRKTRRSKHPTRVCRPTPYHPMLHAHMPCMCVRAAPTRRPLPPTLKHPYVLRCTSRNLM